MTENKALDIIKKAIILEYRGKALYQSVTPDTGSPGVKELFDMLAEEEDNHIKVLNQQFQSISKGGKFDAHGIEGLSVNGDSVAAKILTEKIVKEISGAGYEAAVISAALEFEKKAVEFYSQQVEKADSEEEKKIFLWLSDWEKGHMAMLALIDKELMEKIWFDNSFWPLD
jgi:rubrerythrin